MFCFRQYLSKKKRKRREKIKNGIWFLFRVINVQKKQQQIQKTKQKNNKQAQKPKQNKTKIYKQTNEEYITHAQ